MNLLHAWLRDPPTTLFPMQPHQQVVLLLLLPLAAAAWIALALRRQGRFASYVSVAAAVVVAGLALALVCSGQRDFPASWEWLRLGDFSLSIGFKFDDLAAL